MIEINLLPGQKKKAGAGFSLPDLGALATQVKDPLLIGAVGVWGLVIAGAALVFITETRALSALETTLSETEREYRRYQALINQKRKAESLRDSLLTELSVIREIDSDRYVWPHVLDEVAKTLPEYTWLVGLDAIAAPPPEDLIDTVAVKPPIRFQIDGRTSDIGAYTRFLRQLSTSPWFTNVVAGATQTVIEEDRPVTAFTITITFQQADSAFIRTAPVIESVR